MSLHTAAHLVHSDDGYYSNDRTNYLFLPMIISLLTYVNITVRLACILVLLNYYYYRHHHHRHHHYYSHQYFHYYQHFINYLQVLITPKITKRMAMSSWRD